MYEDLNYREIVKLVTSYDKKGFQGIPIKIAFLRWWYFSTEPCKIFLRHSGILANMDSVILGSFDGAQV